MWAAGGRNWGGADDEESIGAVHAALDHGINLIDTAAVYGFGRAERVLGKALPVERPIAASLPRSLDWLGENDDPATINNELRPAAIRAECEASLKRLDRDTIDLWQCHWPLPGDAMTRTVAEDMVAMALDLREAGKIRYFGVSNFTIQHVEWCGGADVVASIQPELSLLRREAARELIPWCAGTEDRGAVLLADAAGPAFGQIRRIRDLRRRTEQPRRGSRFPGRAVPGDLSGGRRPTRDGRAARDDAGRAWRSAGWRRHRA